MLDLYLTLKDRIKVKEIAITLNERKNGNSKISLNILIKIIKLIFFHLFLKDLKKTKELM